MRIKSGHENRDDCNFKTTPYSNNGNQCTEKYEQINKVYNYGFISLPLTLTYFEYLK
jgi:hypothetical protein